MDGLGIDLGTANTVVCSPRQGVVLDEPSVMLIRLDGARRPKPLAIGREAQALIGRTPVGLATVRPLRDGVVTDLETARSFIVAILRRLSAHRWQRIRVRAVIGVPVGATTLERRALLEAAEEAGIGKAALVAEPIAGAVGCGLDPHEPRTHMVVDVGGGTAEVTAFCFGGVLTHRSCRVAGDEMTLAVHQYLRQEHQLVVGELTAEDLKIRTAGEESGVLVVEGRDAGTGRPQLVTLEVAEVMKAIQPVTDAIIQTLAACLDDLPPQGVSDIMADGILAFGGGSLLRGFDKLVEMAFGFSVRRAERPLTCVGEGASRCLGLPAALEVYGGG